MLILDRKPTFKNEWKIETAARKAIILPLIDRIKNANSFNDLENKSACNSSDNIYFVYNGVGKLYFQHFNNEDKVRLI